MIYQFRNRLRCVAGSPGKKRTLLQESAGISAFFEAVFTGRHCRSAQPAYTRWHSFPACRYTPPARGQRTTSFGGRVQWRTAKQQTRQQKKEEEREGGEVGTGVYSLRRHASSIPGNLTNNSDRLRCSPSPRDHPRHGSLPPRNHYGYHYFRCNDEGRGWEASTECGRG